MCMFAGEVHTAARLIIAVVAMQREVVASRRIAATRAPSGKSGGALGFSLAIQGVIAKDGQDRALACESWRESEATLAALDARKQLIGFYAGFLPGIRANLKKCAEGAPIRAFGPLKS